MKCELRAMVDVSTGVPLASCFKVEFGGNSSRGRKRAYDLSFGFRYFCFYQEKIYAQISH